MTTNRSLKQHLANIHNRLVDDVGPYVELIVDYAVKNTQSKIKAIGNFSLIRMLFPIIESVAKALDKTPQKLLEELKVPLPYLTWSIFRDVFSHNDEFESAFFVEGETMYIAHPGIAIPIIKKPVSHSIDADKLIINPVQIYHDLVTYLETQKFQDKEVQVAIGILYTDTTNSEVSKITEELKQIAGRYKKQVRK